MKVFWPYYSVFPAHRGILGSMGHRPNAIHADIETEFAGAQLPDDHEASSRMPPIKAP